MPSCILITLSESQSLTVCCVILRQVATCNAFIRNAGQLFALRMLLGALEAGSAPSAWHLLAQFYPQDRCGLRCLLRWLIYACTGCTAAVRQAVPHQHGTCWHSSIRRTGAWHSRVVAYVLAAAAKTHGCSWQYVPVETKCCSCNSGTCNALRMGCTAVPCSLLVPTKCLGQTGCVLLVSMRAKCSADDT